MWYDRVFVFKERSEDPRGLVTSACHMLFVITNIYCTLTDP